LTVGEQAEDELFELSILRHALGDNRFEFECASGGSEARERLKARPGAVELSVTVLTVTAAR